MSDGVEMIIVDWDGGDMLERCLESVRCQTELPRRLIIWDNGSQVSSAVRVGEQPFETLFLRSETNVGFTGGINGAMRLVEDEYVAWVNNDVLLHPAWLRTLKAALQTDRSLGAVQSVIVGTDGNIDGAGITVASGRYLQIGHSRRPDEQREEAWGISGTAALFRTQALRESAAGGAPLHPAFFAYYEDVELSARLRARGFAVQVIDEPLATHHGSRTGARLGDDLLTLRVRNRYWVHRLHPRVGRVFALLHEDLRALARDLVQLRFRSVRLRLTAIIRGLIAPIR